MTVQPIRPDILPESDVERELIEFFTQHIREHCQKYGPPNAMTVVLIHEGEDATIGSWITEGGLSRQVACSWAATLLQRRAMGIIE